MNLLKGFLVLVLVNSASVNVVFLGCIYTHIILWKNSRPRVAVVVSTKQPVWSLNLTFFRQLWRKTVLVVLYVHIYSRAWIFIKWVWHCACNYHNPRASVILKFLDPYWHSLIYYNLVVGRITFSYIVASPLVLVMIIS